MLGLDNDMMIIEKPDSNCYSNRCWQWNELCHMSVRRCIHRWMVVRGQYAINQRKIS